MLIILKTSKISITKYRNVDKISKISNKLKIIENIDEIEQNHLPPPSLTHTHSSHITQQNRLTKSETSGNCGELLTVNNRAKYNGHPRAISIKCRLTMARTC